MGGGNNTSGCADMYALDLSPLGDGPLEVRYGVLCVGSLSFSEHSFSVDMYALDLSPLGDGPLEVRSGV